MVHLNRYNLRQFQSPLSILRIILALLLLILALAAQAQDELVTVTSLQTLRKGSKANRLQIISSHDSIRLLGFGLGSLPRRVRKFNFGSPERKLTLSTIRAAARKSLDEVYALQADAEFGFSKRPMNVPAFVKYSDKFLRKRKSPYFMNQWVDLGSAAGSIELGSSPGFYSKGWLKKRAGFLVDELPGAVATKFPAVDPYDCVPAHERYFKLRKMRGYGVDNIKYTPYQGKKREIIRKAYEVYFPVNSTEPGAAEIQNVKDFLQQNYYEILVARMEGGCSVEGDSIRNNRLQTGRAHVLAKALKKFNNSAIKRDTVLLTDSWISFRKLLAKSAFKELDSLDDATLANEIRKQESVRKKLEPIFILQRKASLNLVIAKVFSHDERIMHLQAELFAATARLNISNEQSGTDEAKVMGMLSYLFDLYLEGEVSKEQFTETLTETAKSDYLNVLVGYHIMKQFEGQRYPKTFSTWAAYWDRYNLETWFTKGQQSLLSIAETAMDRKSIIKFRKMLVDYQAYSFRFIQAGLLDINSLCSVRYPYLPAFRSLQLYQFGYLYELTAQGKKIDCMSSQEINPSSKKDTTFNADTFLDDIRKEIGITKSTTVVSDKGTWITKPSYNTDPKSLYYTLLKEKFVFEHNDILGNFEYVDDEAPVELDGFNLYHLLRQTVSEWNPNHRYYYDKDVQFYEIGKLVDKMKKLDGLICTPQVKQLYLDYHLKSLYYLERYFEPGNVKQTKIADASIKFITDYYKIRVKALTPALSLHIVKQMNLFNWLPGSRCGAVYGYEILKIMAKQRMLNEEELKLYAHYIRLYDPAFKSSLSPLLEKEKLVQLGREPYRTVKLTASRLRDLH
jgi:hypothetical protein